MSRTITDNQEPTLADVIEKLDKLSQEQEQFNERFSNYQQANQWVVQLAFTLIASATLTVIITAVINVSRVCFHCGDRAGLYTGAIGCPRARHQSRPEASWDRRYRAALTHKLGAVNETMKAFDI